MNSDRVKEWCGVLRESEKRAIADADWDQYWDIHRVRMNLVRDYFPQLFFNLGKVSSK